MAPSIWLIRHGNREDFVDPAWRDHAAKPDDPPLSADGVVQARRAGERLVGSEIERIYASPFLRTVQTASEIAEVLGLPVCLEPGLGEYLNPEWFPVAPEWQTNLELARAFPRVTLEHRALGAPTYPETLTAAFERAAATVRLLAAANTGSFLCVGHGASVCGAVMLLAEEAEETHCPLTGLFKLVRAGTRWSVELRADTRHLAEQASVERYH